MANQKKVRYAVIGAGWISQEAFLPAIEQTGNSEVAAIVSGSLDKARQLADFYGIARVLPYEQFDALAASGDIDAVYIATPNSSHARFALQAARHRLHILVEKPLAVSLAEAESMQAAADEAGVYLLTAYRLHNAAAMLKLSELIQGGAIGDPRFFSSHFGFQITTVNHRLDQSHWGGPLQDLGVYCLNAARHVFGSEPVEIQAMSGNDAGDPRFAEVDAAITATLRFDGGRIASFFVSFGADPSDVIHVLGTKGSIEVRHAYLFGKPRTIVLRVGDTVERFEFAQTDNFSGMVAYLSDCILNGTPPVVDSGEGVEDMRALLAIEQAAASGAPVRIASRRPFTPLQASMERSFPPVDRKLVLP